MGRRLFVGNLNFKTTSEDLKELFGSAGTCEWATVMTDRATGKSRGFGFVEMGTDEEAVHAIEEMNGKEYQGRNLNVNEARERTPGGGGGGAPRAAGGGYGGGYGGGRSEGGYRGDSGSNYRGSDGPPPSFGDMGGDYGGFGGGFGGGGGGGRFGGGGGGPKPRKEGGSRRGLRAKKRSL